MVPRKNAVAAVSPPARVVLDRALPVVIAYIGLGSNLAEPESQLHRAFDELHCLPQSRCIAQSSLYRSAPMQAAGAPDDQPDYINAVATLETGLEPLALLAECQRLEELHQRVRGRRWGPRTLDLDVLLYGEHIIDTPELSVPHPGLYERNFVLYPLAEVVAQSATEQMPRLLIPGRGSLASLLAVCSRDGLEKLN